MCNMGSPQQAPPMTMGSQNTVFIIDPWFDPSYVKTIPGMLKVAVVVLDLLGFICIQSSAFWSNGRGVYFNIVAHLGLWFSGIMLALYLYHIVEKYHNVPWLRIELVVYVLLTFLYLIASTIVVAFGSAAYSAAGFFGYIAMVVYGFDAFLKVKAVREGEVAQGRRAVVQQQQVVTPPALP
ncbi:CKLF-like MARVEL transmembrane domain-containing protein 4 [Pectinophora gossypiella]|uniref:CKLF-like MARVEL transmembrane domain-containing protein 4 n=1 Tax=Pectinophora gossypiella TaxID=13191 RepID=UPI00214F5428|nr:CKLF-like MARVEL transmembrane domain-containing protein 4 [Pectinophora gossypiella]